MVLSDQTTPQPLHSQEESLPTTFAPIFPAVLKLLKQMQVDQSSAAQMPTLSILFPMYLPQVQGRVYMQPPHFKQQAISSDMQVSWEEEPQLHGEELPLISLQAKADS